MEHFYFEKKITPFKDSPPITFAHNRSFDDGKKHSLHLNGGHTEIYVYISGEVDFIVDDRYYPLESGDILIINPNQLHVAVPKKPTEYERFYILLPAHALERLKHDPLLTFLNRDKTKPAKVSLPAKQRNTATELLYKVSDILKAETSLTGELNACAVIMEFLCVLEKYSDNIEKSNVNENIFIPDIIKNLLCYIGQNATKIGSASEIADIFHLSPPYLSSLFKKYVGVNLSTYLRTKRIAIAKELLEKGHSVSYACYESGFSDSSYFIKVFKEQTGTTPHRYKQLQHRGKLQSHNL